MIRFYSVLILLFSVVACENMKGDNSDELLTKREQKYQGLGELFGEDTFIFGGDHSSTAKASEVGIGVNSFLWRAALDTLSFMPLKSVDPFGGVILTDWYTSFTTSDERIKVDVLILTRQLRADGLKVTVFQQQYRDGRWIDHPLNVDIGHKLEDLILTRARDFRIRSGK